jgi:hypothetical protein
MSTEEDIRTWNVVWTIEIEAETAEEAARKALEIHRDPESNATVFEVNGETIDLTEIDDPKAVSFPSWGLAIDAIVASAARGNKSEI